MAAADRYDGPLFRTLRATLALVPRSVWPDVVVLSAHYGLIPPDRPIRDYDRKMDPARADELVNDDNFAMALRTLSQGADEIYVSGGKRYRDVVMRAAARLPPALQLPPIHRPADGTTIGLMRSDLRNWLLDSFLGSGGAADSEIEASLVPSVDPLQLRDMFGVGMQAVSRSRSVGWVPVDVAELAEEIGRRLPGCSQEERHALAVRSIALYNALADPELEQPIQMSGPALMWAMAHIGATLPVIERAGDAEVVVASFRKAALVRRVVRYLVDRHRRLDQHDARRREPATTPASAPHTAGNSSTS